MRNRQRAKAVLLLVLSYPYINGGKLTHQYDPDAYSTAYYFHPDNDNYDVLYELAKELFDGEPSNGTDQWLRTLYELTFKGTSISDIRLRSHDNDTTTVGFMKDITLDLLEVIRAEIRHKLANIDEDKVRA